MSEQALANNVITGPWAGAAAISNRDALMTEVVTNGLLYVKHDHICDTLVTIVPMLLNNIELAGFDIDSSLKNEEMLKDVTVVIESLKSLLCKYYGFKHPLQQVAENLFTVDEEGVVEFVDKLEIVFDPEEPIVLPDIIIEE